jgi:DNA helicase MCM8
MDEMNRFEFQIHHKLPDMYLQAALGAHLHFFPLQALPAVNVAMALAVATLWRKLHVTSFQQQHPSSSHIGSTATAQPPLLVNLNHFLDSCVLVARFIHVYPQLPMASVKTGLVHKFISIKGHVIKARPRRLRVAYAEFTCQKCSTVIPQTFEKGQFDVPTSCTNQSCRSRSFVMERSTARYTNVQEIRLQEAQDESTAHAGRTPRQIDVEVTDDLIDACRPGDIVLLACYVDVVNSAIAAGRAGKRANENSTYKLFLQGHSITSLSETSNKSSQQSQQSSMSMSSSGAAKQSTFTQAQLQNIVQLCHADHRCLGEVERRAFPFDLLVRSLCPSIIGHHSVKAGILLCLLGGTPPSSSQMDRGATIRSNSHILIVGDPGMGKSQMLLAATQLAARSVYVGGNTSSTTGLTVTMTKEEGGETGIEAGALVLADQGVACIDELDKCKHLDGLLEAMEQQSVSIAKAGVVASLPSRCSVIAAANPKHGSYNMSKTVAENLNMARPILSRFDLIFILRDRADKVQDQLVSSNILNIYTDHGLAPPIQQCDVNASNDAMRDPLYRSLLNKTSNGNTEDCNDDTKNDPNRISMEKRLEWVASFNDPLPAELVRDYIAYAREYCHPKLTTKAAFILRDYYLSLRYPSHGKQRRDTVPITTRQLEALIRLSQARAKACLREFVLEEDAKDVVELLKCSNLQVHTDEFGLVDVSRGGAGGQSNRKVRKEFVKRLYDIVGENGVCDKGDLLRIADHVDMGRSDFETTIEELRLNGTLMRQSDGKYKVLP